MISLFKYWNYNAGGYRCLLDVSKTYSDLSGCDSLHAMGYGTTKVLTNNFQGMALKVFISGQLLFMDSSGDSLAFIGPFSYFTVSDCPRSDGHWRVSQQWRASHIFLTRKTSKTYRNVLWGMVRY